MRERERERGWGGVMVVVAVKEGIYLLSFELFQPDD